jgi:hypothetical protein
MVKLNDGLTNLTTRLNEGAVEARNIASAAFAPACCSGGGKEADALLVLTV